MGLIVLNDKIITLGSAALSIAPPDPEIYVTPATITSISYTGATCSVNVCGGSSNSTTVADACNWIVTTSPVSPSASPGTANSIQICENITSSCRSGVVCYTPSCGGAVKCVTICQSTGDTNIYVTPATISSISSAGCNYYSNIKVCGPTSNTVTGTSACNWIIVCNTPISPSASPGTTSCVRVCANTGAARTGYVCYAPTVGTAKCVCFCQLIGVVDKCVNIVNTYCNGNGLAYARACGYLCASSQMDAGEYYNACFYWYLVYPSTCGLGASWNICRNGSCICGCSASAGDNCSGYFSVCVPSGDTINIFTLARVNATNLNVPAEAYVQLQSIGGCSNYYLGSGECEQYSCTCGQFV